MSLLEDLKNITNGLGNAYTMVSNLNNSLAGFELSAAGMLTKLKEVNSQLQNLSISSGATGAEFEKLEARVFAIGKKFGYTAESIISMQKSLMIGFRFPIQDAETFVAILSRSGQLFGKNEEAAKSFVQALQEQTNKQTGLRDSILEIVVAQGKLAQSSNALTDSQRRSLEINQKYSKSMLDSMLYAGEITREDYMNTLFVIQDMSEEGEKVNKNLVIAAEQAQKAVAGQVAATRVLRESASDQAVKGLGVIYAGGSQAYAAGVSLIEKGVKSTLITEQQITAEMQEQLDLATQAYKKTAEWQIGFFEAQREDRGTSEITDEEKKFVAEEISPQLKGITNFDEARIKAKEKLKELNANYSEEELESLIKSSQMEDIIQTRVYDNRVQQQLAAKILDGTITQKEKIGYLETKNAAIMQDLRINMQKFSEAANSSVQAMMAINSALGKAGSSSKEFSSSLNSEKMIENYRLASRAASELVAFSKQQAALTEKEVMIKLSEDPETTKKNIEKAISMVETRIKLSKESGLFSEEQYSKELERIEKLKGLANTAMTSSNEKERNEAATELNKLIGAEYAASQQNAANIDKIRGQAVAGLIEGINNIGDATRASSQQRLEYLKSENSLLVSQVSLMDSLAVGIGASAQMRQEAAMKTIEQAKEVRKQIEIQKELELKALKGAETAQTAEEKLGLEAAARDAKKKAIELQAEENNLRKTALDQMQKLREGYLDAINAMESGAGIFTEIVVNQEKNLGSLIRTTAEVPRVLRTGAGSGGILQATSFGPGGIVGGEGPKSEEYSKHVLTNFDQINALVEDLPAQIGKSTAENLAIAAKANPWYESQIDAAATPGKAGALTASGATVSIGDQAARQAEATEEVARQLGEEKAKAQESAQAAQASQAAQVAEAEKAAEGVAKAVQEAQKVETPKISEAEMAARIADAQKAAQKFNVEFDANKAKESGYLEDFNKRLLESTENIKIFSSFERPKEQDRTYLAPEQDWLSKLGDSIGDFFGLNEEKPDVFDVATSRRRREEFMRSQPQSIYEFQTNLSSEDLYLKKLREERISAAISAQASSSTNNQNTANTITAVAVSSPNSTSVNINGTTVDMSPMINTIANVIQRGMVDAVEKGTKGAVREIESGTAV